MMTTSLATVAVIGSGTMGAGIAEVAAAAGHPVRIFDINQTAIARAIDGIAMRLASRVARANWRQSRPMRCWRACIRPTI